MSMPWTFWLMELSTYIFGVQMFLHAKKQGTRWASTMFWGVVFGLAIELALVHGAGSTYSYGQFLVMLGWGGKTVPLWVGVGWGAILYAATWTAQRLALPWYLRPLAAALLAVNIDLSLDPIAEQQGFWHWRTEPDDLTFYGVPFDNYMGWFAIVGCYAGYTRLLFRKIKRGTWGSAYWIPLVGAALSLVTMLFFGKIIPTIYATFGGQITVFAIVFTIACAISWGYALKSRRDHEKNWPVLALPIYFHMMLLFVFVATGAFRTKELTTVLVLIPLNLFVGFFGYGWVSLEKLFPMPPELAVTPKSDEPEPVLPKAA